MTLDREDEPDDRELVRAGAELLEDLEETRLPEEDLVTADGRETLLPEETERLADGDERTGDLLTEELRVGALRVIREDVLRLGVLREGVRTEELRAVLEGVVLRVIREGVVPVIREDVLRLGVLREGVRTEELRAVLEGVVLRVIREGVPVIREDVLRLGVLREGVRTEELEEYSRGRAADPLDLAAEGLLSREVPAEGLLLVLEREAFESYFFTFVLELAELPRVDLAVVPLSVDLDCVPLDDVVVRPLELEGEGAVVRDLDTVDPPDRPVAEGDLDAVEERD